jgi:hypothetical protein
VTFIGLAEISFDAGLSMAWSGLDC